MKNKAESQIVVSVTTWLPSLCPLDSNSVSLQRFQLELYQSEKLVGIGFWKYQLNLKELLNPSLLYLKYFVDLEVLKTFTGMSFESTNINFISHIVL